MRTYHDDLVMSLAIGCWVRDPALTINQRKMNYQKAFLDSMIMSTTKLNTQIPGQRGYDQDYEQKASKQMSEYQQYSWLLKG